ncbi:SDR family NAD(P)-dependent oxidoreductase [Streptomyces sp. NPDC004610]|uniref:SDR family NAD(P)-dependent oxidoreductase n=1 Tax=unclassified Streptomyces TaxID=2593676 RepID=UPI0033B53CC2
MPADATDAGRATVAVRAAVDSRGRLDVLVDNAGTTRPGPTPDAPVVTDREDMVRVTPPGSLRIARAAPPHLVGAAGDGPRGVADLVGIGSVSRPRGAHRQRGACGDRAGPGRLRRVAAPRGRGPPGPGGGGRTGVRGNGLPARPDAGGPGGAAFTHPAEPGGRGARDQADRACRVLLRHGKRVP